MKDFFLKKILPLTLVICLLSSYLLFPFQVRAQSANSSIGGSLEGVGGVIANCAISLAKKAIQDKIEKKAAQAAQKADKAATDISAAATTGQVVPILSKVELTAAGKIKNEADFTKIEAKSVKIETRMSNFKEDCLDAIARFAVLKIIDKMTLMTVEWINEGFQGNPFYPEDRPNFFEQIAKDEVTSFTGWFSADATSFPFGKIISETILMSVQNTLQSNLRFSLNQVLQHQNQYATYENFQARLSVGGWAGYTAFAEPRNNVFGNYMLANNHLARQTAGTSITIAANFQKQLGESGGLLNQQKCEKTASPGNSYIPADNDMHLGGWTLVPAGQPLPASIWQSLPPNVLAQIQSNTGTSGTTVPTLEQSIDQAAEYNTIVQRSTCLEWRTVTPGRFIAEQTTQVLGSPLRNLELADELNENLGLIFDALVAKLFQEGLKSFQRPESGYSSDPSAPNYSPIWSQSQNPDFGSTTIQTPIGVTLNGNGSDPSLLQIQQSYLNQTALVLESLSSLIKSIRLLDYCVPGPNPHWYDDGLVNIESIINSISPDGNAPYYVTAVNQITGITVPESVVPNVVEFESFINFVVEKYREFMMLAYSTTNAPPAIRPLATSLYNQIEGYEFQTSVIQEKINDLTLAIPQLQSITNQYNALAPAVQSNPNSPEMITITSLFNQLLNQNLLVSQNDLDQLNQNVITYNTQITTTLGYINQCILQVGGAYPALNERVIYPYPSISEIPLYNIVPPPGPNPNFFLNGVTFGSQANQINLSGFNDLNLNIPTTGTEIFSSNLGTLY